MHSLKANWNGGAVYAKVAHISAGGKTYQVEHENTHEWATRVPCEHRTQDDSRGRQCFEQNAAELEAALALLVAESDAKNKDVMIRLIENMLALPTPAGA